jgi:pyruvate/2-oxoglutarate dehydrogenase complex dihydrolipoamide acyltransferase (E2) component
VPEIEPPKTAVAAKAEATTPRLRPGRSRSYGRWAGVAGLLAAVVVVIVLIAGGGDDDNSTVADTNPATTPSVAAPTATSPAVTTPSAAAPTAAPATPVSKPVVRRENCDPIIGSGTANSGKTYDVTSSAKDGDPAACDEAHSTLLSALQGGGTSIDEWTCKTNPSGNPVATCTSTGGRSIQATG